MPLVSNSPRRRKPPEIAWHPEYPRTSRELARGSTTRDRYTATKRREAPCAPAPRTLAGQNPPDWRVLVAIRLARGCENRGVALGSTGSFRPEMALVNSGLRSAAKRH